ncbi:hypothetical protein BH11BAC4_BH11BAC4_15190 [soil metagenome]
MGIRSASTIKQLFSGFLFSCFPFLLNAQFTDSSTAGKKFIDTTTGNSFHASGIRQKPKQISATTFIVPAGLITYGFIALGKNDFGKINTNVKSELLEDHPAFITKIDNYLQYAPAVAVYALNIAGIKGKNNFRDRSLIYAMSTLISSATVISLKKITKVERPDGSGNNSFPSGHTTTAFAAAEFLRMEYKDVSPWIGVAGYLTATATGILRIYNNKHWVNDVVAGAGFGILSTKLAYWIYPAIQKRLFKKTAVTTFISPYYQPGNAGFTLIHNFN